MIQSIPNGLHAEILKQKRTTVYWFALLAPVSMAFLYFLVFNDAGVGFIGEEDPWKGIFIRGFSPIKGLMLPLFISVVTSLVHFTEHKNHTWKHIYALPISKGGVFFNKSLFSFLLVCLVLLCYPLLIVVSAYIASFTNETLSILRESEHSIMLWENGILPSLQLIPASFAIWAMHNWLGYRLKSFAMPIGAGLIGTITGLVMLSGGVEKAKYFPYCFGNNISSEMSELPLYQNPLVLGASIGLIIFIFSIIDAVRRDID